jgi:hypothetical protein
MRNPKVCDFDLTAVFCPQEIGGLDIAVNYPLVMDYVVR